MDTHATEGHQLTVPLALAPELYAALGQHAQQAQVARTVFCADTCRTALEQYGQAAVIASRAPTAVLAVHLVDTGTDLVAAFSFSAALYMAVWGRAQERQAVRRQRDLQQELVALCREICQQALALHVTAGE